MASGKELKFQFVLDESSFRRVTSALDQMLSKTQQLAKSLSGIQLGGAGGILSGGTVGRPGSTQSTLGGSANSVNRVSTTSIGSAILKDADAFAKLAASSKTAMGAMTEALRRGVKDQENELQRIDRIIGKINNKYNTMNNSQAATAQNRLLRLQAARNTAQGNLNQLNNLMPGQPPPLPGQAPAAPWQMPFAGAAHAYAGMIPLNQLNNLMPGQPPLPGQAPAAPWQMPFAGAARAYAGMIPPQIRAAMTNPDAGLAGVGLWGLGAIAKTVWNAPRVQSQFNAQQAALQGGDLLSAYHGDFRNQYAMATIRSDPNMMRDYNDLGSNWRHAVYGVGGVLGGIWNRDTTQIGNAISGKYGSDRVLQDRQEMIANQRKSDPLLEQVLGDFKSGARGNMALMRSLGWGGAKEDGSGMLMRAKLEAAMGGRYTAEEYAGAKQGVEAVSTRHASNFLAGKALDLQSGGIANAAGIIGQMARFGTGVGANFANALGVAGAATDPLVASAMGSFTGGYLNNLGTGNLNGLGLMGTVGFGVGGDQQRLIAEQNIKGIGAMDSIMNGSTSGYQRGRNIMEAYAAMPDANIYSADYASKMGFGQLAEIMGGGDVSATAKAMGLTREGAIATGKGKMQSIIEGYVNDPASAGTSMGRLAQALQTSGMDANSWFKKNKNNLSQFGFKNAEDAAGALSGMLLGSGEVGDEASAMGAARDIFGLGSSASTKGKQVGDVASGSMEAKDLKAQADLYLDVVKSKLIPASAQWNEEITKMTFVIKKNMELLENKGMSPELADRWRQALAEGAGNEADFHKKLQELEKKDDISPEKKAAINRPVHFGPK
jgi:hypothetical protein